MGERLTWEQIQNIEILKEYIINEITTHFRSSHRETGE